MLNSQAPIISGLPIRQFLKSISFVSEGRDSEMALAIVFGAHENASTFPSRGQVQRSLQNLAFQCAKQIRKNGKDAMLIEWSQNDFISNIFFTHLQNLGFGLDKKYSELNTESVITKEEKDIILSLCSPFSNVEKLILFSVSCAQNGDYQTAYKVLSAVSHDRRTDNCHYILGLCCSFFARTEEAEVHFLKMLGSENILSQLKASFYLSDLYLRLHPKEQRDAELAENFLNESYRLFREFA